MTEKLFSLLYVVSLLECISFRMSLLVSFQRMALLVAIFQGVFIFVKVFSNTWVLGLLNTIPFEPRDRYARQFAVGDSKTLLTTLDQTDGCPLSMAITWTLEVQLTRIIFLWQDHFQGLVMGTEIVPKVHFESELNISIQSIDLKWHF